MRWTHIIPQRTREMIRAQLMRISNQRIYLRHKRRADLLITKAGIEFQPSENASKHILFIVIDCLRKDHLSLYGYKRKTTPFLDCFAEESLVFRDVIDQECPEIIFFSDVRLENTAGNFYIMNA